ncbi:MAG: hypothetical protein WD602_10310 [Actinomycetota bacterium]
MSSGAFPSTFAGVSMIIGIIWMVQGFGVLGTGSAMDGQSFWGVMGIVMFAVGLAGVIIKRRRRDAGPD